MNTNDMFEKFWAEDCSKRPLHSHPTSIEKECARRSYSAGAEQMRERIADMADEEAPTHEDAYYGGIATVALGNFAARIRALPVGESGRAPEGTKP